MGTASPGPPGSTCTAGGCEISEVFATLGRAHTLDILHLFLIRRPTPVRFIDVQTELRLSPNTVSERLRTLVEVGLLARTVFNEVPPRVEYAVTPKLLALEPVFRELTEWSRRHTLKATGRPEPSPSRPVATAAPRRALA